MQYALGGAGDGSVAIRRVADYGVDYPLIALETVAGKTRVMEDNLVNAAGNDVTPAFVDSRASKRLLSTTPAVRGRQDARRRAAAAGE